MMNLKRCVCLCLILTFIFSQTVSATEVTSQSEAVVESPSQWALWDVQMASTYGLGDLSVYQGYLTPVTVDGFLSVEASLEEKLQVTDVSKVSGENMTRGQVITELYDVIKLALEVATPAETLEEITSYFVDNNIMAGRDNNDYALEESCTTQEMLVFAKRVYDHVIYANDDAAQGAFWQVSDEDNTVYLLGSIHVADASTYPLSKEMLQGFASSQALVVEANTLFVNPEDTAYVQEKMMLEEGVTIDGLLSEETYNAYVEKVSALGLTPEVYNKLKPWYAAMLLQTTSMASASYSATMGIDMYFQYLAYGYMPIMEVEGVKYQIDLFDGFSPELQEGYLLSTMTEEASSNEMIGNMLDAWHDGDVETLEAILFAEEGETEVEKEFTQKLWDERNAHMTTYVDDLLKNDSENDYFFVVGAGHMLTEEGIVEGLKALGYEVNRVQ